ncbi:DNA sulfur modification protein DndD [Pseudomonas panipatensis]|uniref:DNA sulfur modification protein DndD n=1 Tax=Pseudomonas panipatensis TaxID=428992 RepID=A0A1G8G4Z4_9PSED|nr:DNA sulfur modification protein DndD [Pseudomonas panipatensis]SDH89366.1 DNA sulfur modification protein DndD [Pseudomonas panipatensis]SMP45386.1 DNA sulfur modification protein DndD [Pseudomonas panipatensis]
MIIKKLVLNNFRVFQGTHEIDLTPRGSKNGSKPIILFGGLNGAGKTSILTAIRLALYGRLAFDELNQSQDYIEQLSSLIHNGVSLSHQPNEASISLTFTYNKEGEESEFCVIRSWERGKKDTLVLLQNKAPLSELNYEQCQGFLNELIPHGIADLFFFDGEKIASLAEDESGKILQTAVRRLLGLDLIAKLRNDLTIYLKRQSVDSLGSQLQNQIQDLDEKGTRLGKSAENFRYAADLQKISIDLIANEIRKHEGLLSAQGGAFARTKAQEQSRVDHLLKERAQLEKTIRHELEGAFPFSLAPKALRALLQRLETESAIRTSQNFSEGLISFMDDLSKNGIFDSEEVKASAINSINSQLNQYLSKQPTGEVILDISERELGILHHALDSESRSSRLRFEKARAALIEVENSLDQAAANIDRAPDDEQLLDIFQKIRELDSKHQEALAEYKSLLDKARDALHQQLECARQLQRLHDKKRSQHGSTTAISNAQASLAMLEKYSEALTIARVHKLERFFEEAYHRLARKDDLQINAQINPQTFDVELVDDQGIAINRKLLSAGEKQIYAIAILEALAKTSGRQLPVIIDTPLGRLDSHHRDKLIENYFPSASHQVILLSTDTEINEHYFFKKLVPSTSHSYQILFNSNTKSAALKKGYFWSENQVGAI